MRRRVSSVLPFEIRALLATAGALLIFSLATPTLFKHFRAPHPQAEAPASIPQQLGQTVNREHKEAREAVHAANPPTPTPRDEAAAKPNDVVVDKASQPETGSASWYDFTTATASGEVMDGDGLTAAHRTLPLGKRVLIENLANGRSVVVRINDRGPVVKGRIIDVSRGAAEALGMVDAGVAKVRVSRIKEAVAAANTNPFKPAAVEASAAR
jgi:peptidoglycan lytic transglycosylase